MAIVSRISVEKAASVKKVVKRGLTQRLRDRVGMGESDSSDEESEEKVKKGRVKVKDRKVEKEDGMSEYEDMDGDGEATLKDDGVNEKDFANSNSNSSTGVGHEKSVSFTNSRGRGHSRGKNGDGRSQQQQQQQNANMELGVVEDKNKPRSSFVQLPFAGLEQSMPADAVLAKEGAEEVSDHCFTLVKWG